MGIFNIALSLEDNNTVGDVHRESEISYYAYMKDPNGLNKADKIYEIVQYTRKIDKNEIRVRKSTLIYPRTEESYFITIKTNCIKSSITVCDECNEKISETFFMQFRNIAENISKKVRYVFRIKDVDIKIFVKGIEEVIKLPYLDYEVDVYSTEEIIHNWVKIDIELDHIKDFIHYYLKDHDKILIEDKDLQMFVPLDPLPLKLVNCFNSNMADEGQKAIKESLYTKEIFKQGMI